MSFDDIKDIQIKREQSPDRSARRFTAVMCTSGKVTDRDKIVAHRDQWLKANEIDVGDLIGMSALASSYRFESQVADEIPGPLSQRSHMLDVMNGAFELDRLGGQLSMVARFMQVRQCYYDRATLGLLASILCTSEPLDVAKAYAEVDGIKALNLGTRYQVRNDIRLAAAWQRQEKAELATRAKEDPGIAKLVAIAEATFKEWSEPSAKRAELMALVAKMEAAKKANKRSSYAGCEASTKAAWKAHLATVTMPKLPSKGYLQVLIGATLTTPEGYLAYEALRLCSEGSEENFYKGLDIIGSDVIRRGPRSATIAAWFAVAGEIEFDDRSLKLERLFRGVGFREGTRWDDDLQGVIASIDEFEGGVEIKFKRVTEKREDCLNWVSTGRLTGFTTAGDPLLEKKCTRWGMVKFDLTADPIKTGKLLATGLRPGMFLYGRKGLAIVATANAKSSVPIWVLGGTVKEK